MTLQATQFQDKSFCCVWGTYRHWLSEVVKSL